jgi:hypothetical protein
VGIIPVELHFFIAGWGIAGMANDSPPNRGISVALWVSAVLIIFAVILLLNPLPFESPAGPATPLSDWVTDSMPVRQPKPQPSYQVAVYTYRCNDCHKIIPAPQYDPRTVIQHREIDLQHGINTRCLNCHHPTNRNVFVDDFGNEIPWSRPQHLCAKCHGPVYRDWQHGSHGRTNGYWNTSEGTQTRRKCIECHDPHRPPFPSLHPAPPPNTLRMGPQDEGDHPHDHDPLRLSKHTAAARSHGEAGKGT